MIDKTFDLLAEEVSIKFKKISAYTNHGPTIGGYREAVIKELIENFISERFTVCTGFVYDIETETSSNQMDILIVDENYPSAYLLKTSDFIIANKDAVVCAIEIKSSFTKTILNDICKKCLSIKQLSSGINFLAFCFGSKVKHNGLAGIYNKLELSDLHYSDHITLYGLGTITKLEENGEIFHKMFWDHTPDFCSTELKVFLSYIMKSCLARDGIDDNPFAKYKPKALILHTDKFKFKT